MDKDSVNTQIPQAIRLLPDATFGLGEGPVWDDHTQRLYWVDIKAPALHSFDPETQAHQTWNWAEVISCCGLADSGEVIVGGRSGLWLFDPLSGIRSLTYPIPALADDVRTNDGKVGPDGAFWISTMQDSDDRGPLGVLMRVSGDGVVRTMLEEITTANGIEWSPDGRSFYLADTRELWVDCWDYDPEAVSLSNRRRFVTFGEGEGKPDGAATDETGVYWSAGIYSGRIHQFSPEGKRVGFISVPAEMVTMPCFGGADMKTLFITSLSRGVGGVPEDGGLYAHQVSTAGPTPRRMTTQARIAQNS